MTQWTDWIDRQKRARKIENDSEVAALAGYDKSLISNWRTGKSQASAERVIDTAVGLRAPVGDALAAAGYIDKSQWSGGTSTPSAQDVPNDELIEELRHRLIDGAQVTDAAAARAVRAAKKARSESQYRAERK